MPGIGFGALSPHFIQRDAKKTTLSKSSGFCQKTIKGNVIAAVLESFCAHRVLNEFLMNSSGLPSALARILTGKQDFRRSVEGTMSVTAFLAFCILGLDFMIYALFQWIYGEKRRAFARQVAARKRARKEQSDSLLPVVTRMAAHHTPRPLHANLPHKGVSNRRPIDLRRGTYTARIA
jgi:hypothetical protein